MNRSTALLLILLRLAIGWHFLFEGLHKVPPTLFGPPEPLPLGTREFSSEAYFREGTGPLARFLSRQVGNPDDEALGRLVVRPIPLNQDPATYPARQRVPPLLAEEWQDYVKRFADHYHLDAQQRAEAQAKADQAEAGVVAWLTKEDVDDKTRPVKRTFPSGTVEERLSIPQRIAEYRAKVAEVNDTLENKLYLLGHDVEGKRLAQAKADAASMRTALLADLHEDNTRKLQDALEGILTPEQKAGSRAEVPVAAPRRLLTWIDWLTVWGLRVVGGCLLAGFLTRLNCLLAAVFLAMTYGASPPFPWLPVPPNSEGHYAWVNKNTVEMLALLTLATTASGRWFGLDALLHELWLAASGRPRAVPAHRLLDDIPDTSLRR
jgi:uncharacterized membrane protein YphA (DoxX/SURF4 family)